MAEQHEAPPAAQAAPPINIYALAERLQPALRPAEAVTIAQELVDTIVAAVLPPELPEEAGVAGWKSRWGVHGPQRWTALREALLARSGVA